MSGDSRPRYGLHRPSKQFGYRKYMYDGNGHGKAIPRAHYPYMRTF